MALHTNHVNLVIKANCNAKAETMRSTPLNEKVRKCVQYGNVYSKISNVPKITVK